MTRPSPSARPAPGRLTVRISHWVTREATGGLLLIGAAVLALLWANSEWRESYQALAAYRLGPEALHLHLPLATWAADGLLAIFFFVVGVELKHEVYAGSLADPRRAAVPVLAAVGGMAVPALIYLLVVSVADDPTARAGWAIPTATDIAFALAVLAVFGRGLPSALRIFLLTLAVVDDLLAIVVIAFFYTDQVAGWPLLGAAAAVLAFGLLVRLPRPPVALLLPVAALAWALMHASGVHATIAGVLLGCAVPAVARHGETRSRVQRYEQVVGPISAGLALPIFAFFAAGVTVVDGDGIGGLLGQPVAVAIVLGLILGKSIGVLGTTALLTRLTPLRLAPGITVRDLLPIGLLAGIGFTVSLLITELSFPDATHTGGAKIAVLLASTCSAALAALALRRSARRTALDHPAGGGR